MPDGEFAIAPNHDNLDGLQTLFQWGQALGLFVIFEAGDVRTAFHPYRSRRRAGNKDLRRIGDQFIELFLDEYTSEERNLLRANLCPDERAEVTVYTRKDDDSFGFFNGVMVWPEAGVDEHRELGRYNTVRIVIEDLEEISMAYGEIYVSGGSSAQSLTTTPAKLNGFTAAGLSSGTTASHSSDQITAGSAGTYRCTFLARVICGPLGATFEFHFRVNGVEQPKYFSITLAADEYADVVLEQFISLAAGDIVSIYGESSEAGGEDLTLEFATLIIQRTL